MNKKLKGLTLLLIAPIILMACGKEEQREIVPMPEFESEEEVDMEQFRVAGDRLKEEPVLSTEERQERFIKQYETIDRPIILNTIRHIQEFDKKHEGSFEGVRLITDKSIDEVKEKNAKTYAENLGEPLNSETTKIYDISVVFPYTEDDYRSYYQTVVNILKEEVGVRTQTYSGIKKGIENRQFNMLKNSGIVRNFQDAVDMDGGLVEQVRPYIQEMDKLVALKRTELGLESPVYTLEDGELEEVPEYVSPKPMTVQEIISIDPTPEMYDSKDEKGSDSEEEQENETTKESVKEESSGKEPE